MERWEQRGRSFFYTEGDWEYLIQPIEGNWRLAERRRGDQKWDTITYCPSLEEAKQTQ